MSREPLQLDDLFRLRIPAAPSVGHRGTIAYLLQGSDPKEDCSYSELWAVEADGSGHRRVAPQERHVVSFAWARASARITYVVSDTSNSNGSRAYRLMLIDLESGLANCVAVLCHEPRLVTWSPNDTQIAFLMAVPWPKRELVHMPSMPTGSHGAPRARYFDRVNYRREGIGFIEHSDYLFVVNSAGGEPHCLRQAEIRGGGLLPTGFAWRADGSALLFASNLDADWEHAQWRADLYSIDIGSENLTRLTQSPETYAYPVPSGDGNWIACLGFESPRLFHPQVHLRLMRVDGSESRVLLDMDREIYAPAWNADGSGVYVSFFDAGTDKLAHVGLDGILREVTRPVGGSAAPNINIFGTPYGVGPDFVTTTTSAPDAPPEIGVVRDGVVRAITQLNAHWLAQRTLGRVEEIIYRSAFDGREMQGWIVRPPHFDPSRTYPLIVEIHGGPNAAYGPKFSFMFQAWAAAGYVVFYPNYRGSTSYGSAFVELTQFDFPHHEHHDILSGVDAVIARGGVDANRLYIVGASAGGTLTAWTIGKSQRFRAAVCMHPMINFSSFLLSWDLSALFDCRWLARPVWEDAAEAWAHSPLSLVANISTPTLVIVGDRDQRTPPSEGEQLYQALQLRKVETALLVRQDMGHSAARPSQEIEVGLHILRWFNR